MTVLSSRPERHLAAPAKITATSTVPTRSAMVFAAALSPCCVEGRVHQDPPAAEIDHCRRPAQDAECDVAPPRVDSVAHDMDCGCPSSHYGVVDLYDVMRTTAAVREFTDDPLPDEVLERILDNARFAPSGGNRQGAHIVVIRDGAARHALAELTKTGARRYAAQLVNGESPWNPLHPPGPTADEIAATDVPAQFTAPLHDAAVVLVVCVDLEVVAAMDQDLDRIGVISGASVYPLVWNILLAARNEGYGGTLTTMAVAEEPRIRELLRIPDSYAVAAVLPLGKPRKQRTKLKRVSVADLATRERFDGEPL